MGMSLLCLNLASVSRKSVTDKPLTPKNGVHTLQQVAAGINFEDISLGSRAKGFLHHVGRRFLAYKEYLGIRELADLSSEFDSI